MSHTAWAVLEQHAGSRHSCALELASATRSVADETVAVVLGEDLGLIAADVAPYFDHVLCLESAALAAYTPDGFTQALLPFVRERTPGALVMLHTPQGRDLAPVLAARLESGLMTDCSELSWEGGLIGTRSVYRRKLVAHERVVTGEPHLATCQPGAFLAPEPGAVGLVEHREVDIEASAISWRIVRFEASEVGEEDITEAEIVVAGGRGLGEKEEFDLVKQLADAIGGVMAASRPVVDMGWVSHDRQVGSSGMTVRPRLYIALGISGAIQHIVGMRESDVIVAINKDSQAPIFEYAHYGVVEDLFKFVPELIKRLNG